MSGLPKAMTQQELEALFTPYGRIITSRILCDNITGTYTTVTALFFLSLFVRVSHRLLVTAATHCSAVAKEETEGGS